jgi:hypothetical protein
MQRLPDWQARVKAVLETYAAKPYKAGRTDCAHFAGDVALACVGVDILADWRKAYTSKAKAARLVHARGYTSAADALAGQMVKFNFEELPAWAARIGDIGASQSGAIVVRAPVGYITRINSRGFGIVNDIARVWAIGE